MSPSRRLPPVLLAALLGAAFAFAPRPAAAQGRSEPFVVEYYYKIKWGFTAEWMELYRRNHYPVLVKQQELGRIVSMSAVTPVNHAGEASRWDLRFTIVWKDAATAHDGFDSSPIARALYPDQARFQKEEQRRFELLLEHMDIPVRVDDLKSWKK
jgi:hypothetical protein